MSDQEDTLDNPDLPLRIAAPLGQWIPDAEGDEVYHDAGTVLPRKTWPSSNRAVKAMIRAGDLEIVKDAAPPAPAVDTAPAEAPPEGGAV